MLEQYIHGYSSTEQERLLVQSRILAEYIFRDIDFTEQKHVLEVGMGVGAETILLLEQWTHIHITGIEISPVQITKARENLSYFPEFAGRYDIIQADVKRLNALDTSGMDAVLLIWVLEHIPQPEEVLNEIHRIMPKGAIIKITEAFHDSLFLYPPSPRVMHYWRSSVDYQYSIGGDPNIGVRLGALLKDTGYQDIQVTPCVWHADKRSTRVRHSLLQFWKDLMYSAFDSMMQAGYVTKFEWDSTALEIDFLMQNPETVFYYHSMQAIAKV